MTLARKDGEVVTIPNVATRSAATAS
jgi:hypothetical protein